MMFRCNHQNTTSAAAFCTDAASCCANATMHTAMIVMDAVSYTHIRAHETVP